MLVWIHEYTAKAMPSCAANTIPLTNQLIKPLRKECRLARFIDGVKNVQNSLGLGGLIHVFNAIDRTRVPEIPARMLHKLLLKYCYVAFTAFKQVMRSVAMLHLLHSSRSCDQLTWHLSAFKQICKFETAVAQ